MTPNSNALLEVLTLMIPYFSEGMTQQFRSRSGHGKISVLDRIDMHPIKHSSSTIELKPLVDKANWRNDTQLMHSQTEKLSPQKG